MSIEGPKPYPVVYDADAREIQYSFQDGYHTISTTPSTVVNTEGALNFTNVSADIGWTPVFTPTVTGMYLYSFYGTTRVNAGTQYSESPNLYLRWTDEQGSQRYYQFAGGLDGIRSDGANQVSIPVWAVAGSAIDFSTSAGNYATARWDFHLTVAKL